MHEASLWKQNAFVTLTYSTSTVGRTESGLFTLRPRDFVLFMKRLRKERSGVRFLQAGEYGRLGRPHHHALLFNCGFPDLILLRRTDSGTLIYRSSTLERLWPLGFSSVGEVTAASAAYVARYTLKKVTGDAAEVHYGGRVPEYLTMSRRPGIGAGWWERWKTDVFPSDEVVLRGGRVVRPPRFYLERLRREDEAAYLDVKARRRARVREEENPEARGVVKEELARRRVADYLKREV